MDLNLHIETYYVEGEECYVYIAQEGSSECNEYEYETLDELKQIIDNYIDDLIEYNETHCTDV